jgi:myo-inositol-1(or 4)-monophosphatase
MSNEVAVLLQAVREAGSAIATLQSEGFSVTRKANNDLLTQADLLANDILKDKLTKAFPDDGWLSEESVDDPKRLQYKRVWVVDPIDGTKEYAHGIPEYAISVALVENGLPILACVYNPATAEFFHAVKGAGAWLGDERIRCDDRPTNVLTLLASRSEYERGEWERFEKVSSVKVIGSIAYKLALVAAGKAHATFSLGPKSEWDIAAGVLLVTEAGGVVTDQSHSPFVFNQENVRVKGIVASAANSHAQVFEMIGVT